MTNHVKVYLQAMNYYPSDFIKCEVCGTKAVDIHHVIPRSKFGSKRKDEQDKITNLIALCRSHHDTAHASKYFNNSLHEIINKRKV